MKNFSRKTKGSLLLSFKETGIKTYLVWIVCAFIVLFFGNNIIGGIFGGISSPLYSIQNYFAESEQTVPVFFRDRNSLHDQIQALEQEISSNQGVAATLEYLTHENNELRALLSASSSPRIGAGVIARPPFTPYDALIIDRGERDGIVAFAPVYHGKGNAVGYVRKVLDDTAIVSLFSSPGTEATVFIMGPDIFTTAYGEGGGIVRLSVPQGIVIETGNVVVLPSLDSGVLGTIDTIESFPTEPEQNAYVTLSVPIQSLRLVSIGTKPLTPKSPEEVVETVTESMRSLLVIDLPESVYSDLGLTGTSTSATSTAHGSAVDTATATDVVNPQ